MAAYEVWIFDRSTEPSQLMGITECPVSYGRRDADNVARTMEEAYAREGLAVSTMVRSERTY